MNAAVNGLVSMIVGSRFAGSRLVSIDAPG
jgi:hypothetical protein